MSPIPGEPLEPKPAELTTSDGLKVTIKVPGLAPPPKPGRAEQRDGREPPRDDPRPSVNPDHAGLQTLRVQMAKSFPEGRGRSEGSALSLWGTGVTTSLLAALVEDPPHIVGGGQSPSASPPVQ